MAPPPARRRLTARKRWARRRDLILAAGHLQGASLRFLGDVFDLDAARVCRILARLKSEFAPKGGLNRATLAAEILAMRRGSARDARSFRDEAEGLASGAGGEKSAPGPARG